MKNEFPAELTLVEVDRPAAGNPADHAHAAVGTVVEVDLATEVLVAADQRGWRETQEADRVRHIAGVALLDQCGIEGNVRATFANAGIDDPERFIRHYGSYSTLTGISS